jgi:long-subunit acyl-CoA synthetase (AMP-forming)
VGQVGSDHNIVIGEPINNYHLYVLDENLVPVSIGAEGELFIGGASLAIGYHKKPDITKARFFQNPFHEGYMYRTGDLACFETSTRLQVLGRTDGQVRIRGFRIEVGDIEAAMDPAFHFGAPSSTKSPEAVFVTGATGFVGAFIAARLLSLNIRVPSTCSIFSGS